MTVYLYYSTLSYPVWLYWILFLASDISMIAYLFGNKVGAYIYNLFHHQGLAVILYVIGLQTQQPIFQLIGLMMLGHSAFDRIMGYGLKLTTGFSYTHLGRIGNSEKTIL